MNNFKLKTFLFLLLLCLSGRVTTAQAPSPLHVEGQFFVDATGKRVNMHGFAQTFSPWFNEQGTKWTNFDVNGCLKYNKGIIDGIMNAGWKMTFVRQHMDPYWSNDVPAGVYYVPENNIQYFKFDRFKKYLDEVFVPMAEYAMSKGLYVVMRPPGVCPENIAVGDAYQQYLLKVWECVAQHPKLKNNNAIIFELANEPVSIIYNSGTRDEAMTQYFQTIVNKIREYCNNILLIPGLGWQSQYAGFAKYPITGGNIGYAVHCYPGWYNAGTSDGQDVVVNYREFKRGWEDQIGPVAEIAPVVVTEMDWGPKKYSPFKEGSTTEFLVRCSFGFSKTGVAGGEGFGANFIRIADETCNVSWLLFTGGEILAKYNDVAADGETFLTDPEACPRPCFRRFQYYASQEYSDMINAPDYKYVREKQPLFSLSAQWFNPSIFEQGTYDEATGALKTGQYGFGGWQYPEGVDLSAYKYLVVELKQVQSAGANFRMFDNNSYWTSPSRTGFGSDTKIVLDLHNLKAYQDDACTKFDHNFDPSHVYIVGFWSYGGSPIYIKQIFLSNDGVTPTGILDVDGVDEIVSREYYTLSGARIVTPARGICIMKTVTKSGKMQVFKVCYK
ncbi:MAG: cellulase family glycosylhydrolase [Prevotella sp.]|nr:cellulase family glycosylhydrolase [Prevotella sp.]